MAYGRNNLATLLLDTGEVAEARELYTQAYQSLTKTLGDNHPNTALIRGNVAKAFLAEGDYAAARRHAEAALEVLSSALPPEHWRLAVVKGNYGAALAGLSEFALGEAHLLEAWERLRQARGPGSETTQRVVAALVDLYRRAGDDGKRREFEALLL